LRIKGRASINDAHKKKKSINDTYMRKSQDNAWLPLRSVHALLQEEYCDNPWKFLIMYMLLNWNAENQVCS
jgi:methyl-CpG-binding domain protein 4